MPKTLRAMEIDTPVGDDVLLFYGMHAREELGRLSEYQLDLLSQKNDIKSDDILGKNITVKVALPTTRRDTSTGLSLGSHRAVRTDGMCAIRRSCIRGSGS